MFFIGFSIYRSFFTPEPPPTVSFGKISFEFPQGPVLDSPEFIIDTVTGTLPVFPTQVKVHRIEDREPDLLSLARAVEKVDAINFTGDPIKLSDSVYQWVDDEPPQKTITMNIFTTNFNLISSYLADSASLSFNSTDTSSAILEAQSFLQSLNLMPGDLDETKTKTSLFSIENFALIPATSISNAKVIQVSFYQRDVNGLPIFYTNPRISPINFLVTEFNNEPTVVEANFNYQRILEENSTYPIKTAEQAFSDLKKGQAFISQAVGGKEIAIKEVWLGYFLGDKKQDFLVPVIVFEGNNFQALVLAVTDEWVNK